MTWQIHYSIPAAFFDKTSFWALELHSSGLLNCTWLLFWMPAARWMALQSKIYILICNYWCIVSNLAWVTGCMISPFNQKTAKVQQEECKKTSRIPTSWPSFLDDSFSLCRMCYNSHHISLVLTRWRWRTTNMSSFQAKKKLNYFLDGQKTIKIFNHRIPGKHLHLLKDVWNRFDNATVDAVTKCDIYALQPLSPRHERFSDPQIVLRAKWYHPFWKK